MFKKLISRLTRMISKRKSSSLFFIPIFLFLTSSCQREYISAKTESSYFLAYQEDSESGRQLFLLRGKEKIKVSLPEAEECAGILHFDHQGNGYFLTSVKTGKSLSIHGKSHLVSRWTGLVKVVPPSDNKPLSSYKIEYLLNPQSQILYDVTKTYMASEKKFSWNDSPCVVTHIKYVAENGNYLILDLLFPVQTKEKEAVFSRQENAIYFVKSKTMKIISEK